MSEYIIYWGGIGSQLTDMLSEHVPPYLWPKRIRQERLREKIVRCRDCKWLDHHNLYLCMLPDGDGGYSCWVVEPDGFCAWGDKR